IKPWCKDDDPEGIYKAIEINARFPYLLSQYTNRYNTHTKIIQIATDCVFDGVKGNYSEKDPHNALDVYGKTKSLGEVIADNFLNIRCSIIGPELKNKTSLMEWFLSHKDGDKIFGFTHHWWNGVTTLQFAQLVEKIIVTDTFHNLRTENAVFHHIENMMVNKYELLRIFNKVFERKIMIQPTDSVSQPVDRTLRTIFAEKQLISMEKAIKNLRDYIKESKIYHD
ncbi:MAG: sugar nucleotide-binding protein, partial [bacterium]